MEKQTAEVKSDTWDLTWKVEMTGRRLSVGWEEFAVAHDFQIGDLVLIRYEGDMVFYVSDLGPNWCEIQDIPFPSFNNYGQYDIGKFSSDFLEINISKHVLSKIDVQSE